jgi:uncharacterized protein YndB with AHSA1/START domain
MATVTNTTRITGPIEAVFDLATTARLWPRWHPATAAVGGVTERPYLVGDAIHERISFHGFTANAVWRVSEHRRPERVAFRADVSESHIVYTFAQDGNDVVFTRVLDYDEAKLLAAFKDAARLRETMHQQSEEALAKLKGLIEGILREEQRGLQ